MGEKKRSPSFLRRERKYATLKLKEDRQGQEMLRSSEDGGGHILEKKIYFLTRRKRGSRHHNTLIR